MRDCRPYVVEILNGLHNPNPVFGIPTQKPRCPRAHLVGYFSAFQPIHPFQHNGNVQDPVFRREPTVPGKRFGQPCYNWR